MGSPKIAAAPSHSSWASSNSVPAPTHSSRASSRSAPASPRATKLSSTSGASSPTSVVPPWETSLSKAETLEKIDQLRTQSIVHYCSIYDDDENFIGNVDNLINLLFSMKRLSLLQELGQDATDADVFANTFFATIPQEILDLVPPEMLASIPEKFKRPSTNGIRTASVISSVQKLKLQEQIEKLDVSDSSASCQTELVHVPEIFLCPISKETMKDPVVLANGETCDRPHIEEKLKRGIWICPKTDEVLQSDLLTPNLFARHIILDWCKKNGVDYPNTENDDLGTFIPSQVYNLIVALDSLRVGCFMNKVDAAATIQKLTKEQYWARRYFGKYPDAVDRLISPLKDGSAAGIVSLQEDLIASVVNILAEDDRNKKVLGANRNVVRVLSYIMKSGPISTICLAAGAVVLLSTYPADIRDTGDIMESLLKLVEQGHPSAMRAASQAICNLCGLDTNVEKAVHAGAVKVILDKIKAQIVMNSFIGILVRLSDNDVAVEQMLNAEAIPLLQSVSNDKNLLMGHRDCLRIIQNILKFEGNRDRKSNLGEPSKVE